ncbi:CoA ester lyase [Altererythrobacter xixiisoli]|uniref:CoA ester lyase n=1 Tax=Croceibacterium xixiisoli TaxID=1476466 RepID=A0A6I4TPJ9_9SPHN|nr:CoA ester lyase [Croceibacterium xixiisoli]MXO98035.1 CoA ester lyase [Croceibacterium xixiisoli]
MAGRSWLFAPGDSEIKLGKVAGYGADVVIVDLEDAVDPARKAAARGLAAEWLTDHPASGSGFGRWVRINAVDTPLWRDDLAGVIAGRPDGIMLPKAAGPAQLREVGAALEALEAEHDLAVGSTQLLPLVSETPAAALTIPSYLDADLPRLAGLTWGAEDLSAAIGAARKRDATGEWTDAFRWVRTQVLLTAHGCAVLPVDTLHADFRDMAGLERQAAASFADGFAGMLAIHPAQVPVINAAYTPGEEQIAAARAIVAAFDQAQGAGVVQLDGRMLDQPHLAQARRLLASIP